MSNYVRWHDHAVQREQRESQKNQKACMLWFTGLSGAGKSTVANAVDQKLFELGRHTYVLDGDNVRHGLCKDLGFSDIDRVENIRRVGEMGRLFGDAGLITLSAFISPFRSDRQMVRSLFAPGEFIEVHISTSLEICEARDPKGLYKKARTGKIRNFTGIDSAYEAPVDPEISLDAGSWDVETCANFVLEYLRNKSFV